MKFFIPTYYECLEIIKQNPDMYFYERKFVVHDYDISIFGYRLATWNNFILPIIDNPNINALELKGMTFVFDDSGFIFNHHLLLPKFWEINQYPHCEYDNYKDLKIKNISVKEDGFLISFLRLPNGLILSFTKRGLGDPINNIANEYLNNSNYYKFISQCLDNNIQPIFECVGSEEKITKYKTPDLVLIKMRNNITGEYLDIPQLDGISIVKNFNMELDQILELSKTEKNIEGWVIHFENDTLLKVKTDWWIKNKNTFKIFNI